MKIGFIALHRRILDHWIYNTDPFCRGLAWLDLILNAFHSEKKILLGNELILVKRGQIITSELQLMHKWQWSKTKVRNFLSTLESDGMIIKESDSKKTTITICNYDKYQKPATDTKPCGNHTKTRQQLGKNTNNNVNNDKQIENVVNAVSVINDYNQSCTGIFDKVSIESLSNETLQNLNLAAKFLATNNVTFGDYFSFCKHDPLLNGTKTKQFRGWFSYMIKTDVIERVLHSNADTIESNQLDCIIKNNDLMDNVVANATGVTDTTKQMFINAVNCAYKNGYSDDDISSCITTNSLTSISIEIFNHIGAGEHNDTRH